MVLIRDLITAAKTATVKESLRGPISQTASALILQFARYAGTFRLSVSTSSGQSYVLEQNLMGKRRLTRGG